MKLKIVIICAFFLQGSCFIGLKAQNSLYIKEKSGTENSFPFNTIKKLTFAAGNVTVNKKDATSNSFVINDVKNFYFGMKTAIPEVFTTEKIQLSLYPNPANEFLYIQYEVKSSSPLQLQIIDLQGKIVFQQTVSNQPGVNYKTISVGNLIHGLYLCRLQNDNKLVSTKFLKD